MKTLNIIVLKNGPYVVHGHILLVRKAQVVSEFIEPLIWEKGEALETGETYRLCRCGHSKDKPFCDAEHTRIGFDGTESADIGVTANAR